ncbi:Flp family type IVb pilin [Bacillus salitolerans]|uniref:Flp family type IVb pilin n=1 Tax=Bacillus salitolerans TaxID=1437434 RepID=A0ABW4LMQ3_9BACI
MKKLIDLSLKENGQGLTEYGLVLGLVSIAVIGLFNILGDAITAMFENALAILLSRE